MTTVLIAGGGVAGTATALALHRAGIASVVYEAHESGGDDAGAFLTVMANGMAALASIDAARAVVAASYPAAAVELFDAEGRHLRHRAIEGPARTLSRATLYRVLQELAVARGIPVVHGKRLVAASVTGDSAGDSAAGASVGGASVGGASAGGAMAGGAAGASVAGDSMAGGAGAGGVEVRFADGGGAVGDILVGADGIHSPTRRLIDPRAPAPRHTGQHVVYGYADGNPAGGAPDAYHMVFGSRAFFGFTAPGDGRTWWFARLPGDPRPGETTAGQWRDLVAAAVRDDATPAAAIIAATGGDVVGADSYDIPTTPRWHNERLVLVGDAAHAASPAAAQGASMALEDAVALAAALGERPGDPAAAFAAYAARRRAQTEETVAASARLGADRE